MNNKVIIILGMHRSGTSLTAGWLHSCGLHIGDRLMGAGIGNVEGHYEDKDFFEAHERILSAHNLPPDGLTYKELPPLRGNEKAQLQALINKKNERHATWGWKEPRTCLFTDCYGELIPDAFYVIVFRDYRSVVSSLITRLYKSMEEDILSEQHLGFFRRYFEKRKRLKTLLQQYATHYLKIWIHYNRKILEFVQQLPVHRYRFATQHSLLQSGSSFIERVKKQWQLSELEYIPFEERYKRKLQSRVLKIAPYIQEKKLLAEARYVFSQLTKMLELQ
ncbi:hypothetical protein A8C56_11070 [Niabella ginsenosidivorans]|uniref:Sulfotransferase domain-containing protein n=1 Tax=Niabella ginsenosidivorans TaxID=1176587 RepID=A0A1A9I1B9_9BACT|nr:sulfotransferase family protein [Niabella ginsenosidivorans]ANH81448.1 hypothetical protein A8C56_11070 [Niabella ginsenosidivorans]